MGYLVETSGRLLLPRELERQALTVLEFRMGTQQGWFDADDDHVDTLEELATFAAASVRREGEWLVLSTDTDGDPKWFEQTSEFYRTLGSFVREGEVHVRGEDGQVWSYLYSGDGVEQRLRDAAGGELDAFIDTYGGGYVDMAVGLGVAPDRIDTIADFPAAQRHGTRTDGNMAGARAEVMAELAGLIDAGELEVPIAATYPLGDVRDAYRELEQRHTLGKIVLLP